MRIVWEVWGCMSVGMYGVCGRHEGTGVWGGCVSVGGVSGVCLWAGVLALS